MVPPTEGWLISKEQISEENTVSLTAGGDWTDSRSGRSSPSVAIINLAGGHFNGVGVSVKRRNVGSVWKVSSVCL